MHKFTWSVRESRLLNDYLSLMRKLRELFKIKEFLEVMTRVASHAYQMEKLPETVQGKCN